MISSIYAIFHKTKLVKLFVINQAFKSLEKVFENLKKLTCENLWKTLQSNFKKKVDLMYSYK